MLSLALIGRTVTAISVLGGLAVMTLSRIHQLFKCDKMLQHLPCDEKMFKLELVLRSEKYLICKYWTFIYIQCCYKV